MLLSLQNVSFYLGDAVHFSSVQSLSLVQFFATTWIMASGPIISWEIDGETVETVSSFIFGGSLSLLLSFLHFLSAFLSLFLPILLPSSVCFFHILGIKHRVSHHMVLTVCISQMFFILLREYLSTAGVLRVLSWVGVGFL